MTNRLILLTCLLFLPLYLSSSQTSKIYHKSTHIVWDRLMQWIEINGVYIIQMDKRSGFGNYEYNLRRLASQKEIKEIMDCHEDPHVLTIPAIPGVSTTPTILAVPARLPTNRKAKFEIIIRKLNTQFTEVNINPKFTTDWYTGDETDKTDRFKDIPCESNRVLEHQILDFIDDKKEASKK